MKREMLTISLVVLLFSVVTGYADEKAEQVSVAEEAFQLRLDGKNQQAKKVLSEYLKEHPDDAVAQFEYSRVLCYLFDLESAEKHAALAVQLEEDNPQFHYWEGMCGTYLFIDQAHHKGHLDPLILGRSMDAFQKAIELKLDYHQARYLLVNLLNNNPPEHGGDPNLANQYANRLMEMDLDYGLRAMMVVEQDRSIDWKIKQYQDALVKEPDNAGLHSEVALLYAESGQIEQMYKHIEKALELDKRQKDILLKITFQLAGKQDYQAAKEMVNRYLEQAKDEPAAMRAFGLHFLAVIERKSGNQTVFEKVAKQMKQTDPDGWRTMVAPPAILFESLVVTD